MTKFDGETVYPLPSHKFTIPTTAYYRVVFPNGVQKTLLLQIGRTYDLVELEELANKKQ